MESVFLYQAAYLPVILPIDAWMTHPISGQVHPSPLYAPVNLHHNVFPPCIFFRSEALTNSVLTDTIMQNCARSPSSGVYSSMYGYCIPLPSRAQ